ncbi:DUF3265 domain-containing protein [Vibrio parahaemolyticus]|nr:MULTISPECIES: DUF3265 domain-containing protein [Vibrio]MCS0115542.1 DUF3265 domain-containing protein [Vibrio parahaemolyticus]WMO24204.1 DUF3265 domain-containing protein [Vibrio parahaemolyticus]
MTICLRVIRNAWHFSMRCVLCLRWHAGAIGIALLTP